MARAMNARGIAAALGNAQREGHGWRARCPVHGGKSLTLADGRDGKLLVKCFGGCEWRDIFSELRNLGLTRDGPTKDQSRKRGLAQATRRGKS